MQCSAAKAKAKHYKKKQSWLTHRVEGAVDLVPALDHVDVDAVVEHGQDDQRDDAGDQAHGPVDVVVDVHLVFSELTDLEASFWNQIQIVSEGPVSNPGRRGFSKSAGCYRDECF